MGADTAAPLGVFVGLATLDVVHRVASPPRRNEKVTAVRQDVAAGGPAAGAAVTYAALGGRARLITALGTGTVAGLVRAELVERGVEVVDVAPGSAVPAPVSAVQVDVQTGERAVVSMDAAAHRVEAPADLDELVRGAAVVLVDGHHEALAAAAARSAAAERDGRGAPRLLLDAGRWRPVMAELMPLADVVICSDDFRLPGVEGSAQTAAGLRDMGVPTVVVSHGGAPVEWWEQGQSGTVEVPVVPVLDTLGAGDAFHGAYAHAVARGLPTPRAAGAAAAVAAHRVGVVGPRDWLDGLPQVLGVQVVDAAVGQR